MSAGGFGNSLSDRWLPLVPPDVQVPAYDRSALRIGVLHLGVGAFHRCHQAEYLDDLATMGERIGLAGISLGGSALIRTMAAQDGLYSRTLARDDESRTRIIGVLRHLTDHAASPETSLSLMADPRVGTVTMTLTEKGYCHIPATGLLDENHPGIRQDLALRLTRTVTAPGFLVAGLARRRAAGRGGLTLISCDNIPRNGTVLRNVVLGVAAQTDPAMAAWIGDHVAFPSTMVDRIVPAITVADHARIEARMGVEDAAAVLGEPFRQWVIENRFAAPRPAWERAGVEIVGDVAGHEQVKLRVLNAAHSILSLLGALRGYETTAEAVRDPDLTGFARSVLNRETLPHLPVVPGLDPAAYLQTCLDRFANRALHHRCHQIATDTSQKIRQRLLDPLRACRAAGQEAPGLETAIAGWIVYLARGQAAFGASWVIRDPVAAEAAAIARDTGANPDAFARRILSLVPVFGTDLSRDPALADRIARRTCLLIEGKAPKAVAGFDTTP